LIRPLVLTVVRAIAMRANRSMPAAWVVAVHGAVAPEEGWPVDRARS
jgi:hypothetical protein